LTEEVIMSDDEKMAERLLKLQHMDVCYPTPHPLCVEAAALIRRRVAEKAKLVEAARLFAYLVEGDFYPTKCEVERLRAAIEEVTRE
jgi:hypothetical protein